MHKKNTIELSNIEIAEYCMLNTLTGKRVYRKKKKFPYFTGLYFRDENTFFALYPTVNGPMMYFDNREYSLHPDLHISLERNGKNRTFFINEYNICIRYLESKYLNFDVWSTEPDVDLFYQICSSYKEKSYYEKFTLKYKAT